MAPDELFFYRYFKDKALEKPAKKKKKASPDEVAEEDNLADVIGEAVGVPGEDDGEDEEGKGDLDDDDFPDDDSDPGEDLPEGYVALA